MKSTYIFPSARQSECIDRLDVSPEVEVLSYSDIVAEPRRAMGDRVLCCNELALYYLASRLPNTGGYGFSSRLLAAQTKLAMMQLLQECGLPTPPTTTFELDTVTSTRLDYPCIVKPDFGFGSQLVYRITSDAELNDFLQDAADYSVWPQRARYAREFFAEQRSLLSRFLVQTDMSRSRFLSVPFLFTGDSVHAFPVIGTLAVSGRGSSFHWRQFEAPARISPQLIRNLEQALLTLATSVRSRPAVLHAELLLDESGNWTFLEFSPRPTGGLVPDLVNVAYGVDIDEIAVLAFLGEVPHVPTALTGRFVGVRRARGEPAPVGRVVVSTTRMSAGHELVDEILEVPG